MKVLYRINQIYPASLWGLLILLFPFSLFGQTDSLFLDRLHKLDSFPKANRLLVDEEGNYIFLQTEESRLHKYIALSEFDSAIHIGGRANRAEGFLNPVEIRLQGRQVLYVLDEVERRIILLNTNFKIIDDLNLINLESGFAGSELPEEIMPSHFDVSPIGELYLLNQLDNKVYKLNAFGELEASFGGLDYGEGSLYEPVWLQVDQSNLVYVADTSQQSIKVFDNYGVYRYSLNPKVPRRWQRFVVQNGLLLLFDPQSVHILSLKNMKGKSFYPQLSAPIIDLFLQGDFLYLLTENTVHLYPFRK